MQKVLKATAGFLSFATYRESCVMLRRHFKKHNRMLCDIVDEVDNYKFRTDYGAGAEEVAKMVSEIFDSERSENLQFTTTVESFSLLSDQFESRICQLRRSVGVELENIKNNPSCSETALELMLEDVEECINSTQSICEQLEELTAGSENGFTLLWRFMTGRY